jgi:ankyrin repeat protein
VSPYPLALVAAFYPDGDSAPIDLLLKHGARLAGSGALGSATYFGKEDSLKYLLEKGGKPDTDAQKIGSWTSGDHPLHSALSGGYLGTARLLLDHGSSVEAFDRNGKSIAEMTAHLEARGHDRTDFTALLSQVAERRLASK